MPRLIPVVTAFVVSALAAQSAPAANHALSIGLKFATVSSSGALVAAQSQGATALTHGGQGKYKITFDISLDRCAVSAASQAGTTSSSTYTYSTRIATAISGSNLYVTLMSKNDGPADYAFSVVLACKEGLLGTPGAGGVKPGSVGAGTGGVGAGTSGSGTSLGDLLRFATVKRDGTLVRTQSYGASSVTHGGTGKFKITFDRSLDACAVAGVSTEGTTTTSTYTFATRMATAISGSSLYVTLMGENDGPADYSFSVVLACTGAA